MNKTCFVPKIKSSQRTQSLETFSGTILTIKTILLKGKCHALAIRNIFLFNTEIKTSPICFQDTLLAFPFCVCCIHSNRALLFPLHCLCHYRARWMLLHAICLTSQLYSNRASDFPGWVRLTPSKTWTKQGWYRINGPKPAGEESRSMLIKCC